MSMFSKINTFLLAFTVVLSSFSQIQKTTSSRPAGGNEIPAYSNIFNQDIWGVIKLDSKESILLEIYLYPDSEEDQRKHSHTSFARELLLKASSSIYLWRSKTIDRSCAARKLLYPFHFYF